MRFTDFLTRECIVAELRARDRVGVLREVSLALAPSTGVPARDLESLLAARERLGTTAMGEGVAIPHCRVAGVERITACVAVHPEGVDFGARDGQPVRLFVALVSPARSAGSHLTVLARVATLLREAPLRQALLRAHDAATLHALLVHAEDNYLARQQARHDIHVPVGGA
jgi:nitrogen PTS system EIIA component